MSSLEEEVNTAQINWHGLNPEARGSKFKPPVLAVQCGNGVGGISCLSAFTNHIVDAPVRADQKNMTKGTFFPFFFLRRFFVEWWQRVCFGVLTPLNSARILG